ncbi:MAG: rhomboid family intramembrane serine protease [Candidatus Tectomicrobia bacterium]|uniref:Rhomboid family intramembrane serine protease n=1 Tax=Tectimicrobiota bacterium TaxID=2528274 RepID=A0A937VY05_UNCTE|nr:rhomboid family intramembrane serine protease [Candidatus Tectomicrobia bacterium]
MQAYVRANGLLLLQCIAVLWIIELLNLMFGHRLNTWGIVPRTLGGLLGIPFSPLLHANVLHLLVNTVPFVVLGGFVMLQGRRAFVETSLFVVFLGGAGVWVIGRTATHIGASGLIFGYFGYLVMRGWYSRSPGALLVALLTVLLYSSMIWGVFPSRLPISWEAHLCGLLAGALAARLSAQDEQTLPSRAR